jgi:V8-like Glu-specific endopeptidase
MKRVLRKRLSLLMSFASLLACGMPHLAWGQMYREALVKPVPPLVADQFHDRGDGVLWEGRLAVRGSLYLRLFFSEITSPPSARYTVVIRGADEKAMARYPAEQFSHTSSFYTDVLFTDTVKVQVEGIPPLAGLSFKVERVTYQVDLVGRLTPESILPNWKNITEIRRGTLPLQFAESVAKLYLGGGFVCSGFLIAPNGLLTNFHCLKESFEYQQTAAQPSPRCSDISIQFDFDAQPSPTNSVRTRCVRVLGSDQGLDYALLEVDATAITSGRSPRRFLTLSTRPVSAQEEVFVIHHPAGLAKKFSLTCTAYATGHEDLLEHDCSTTGGSSGSPVINKDGTVVGLHFGGAYDESMTVKAIVDAVAKGEVFRNKAKPADRVRTRLQEFIQ